VAYGSLLLSTRRALHGRIGRWLEKHGSEELVAELARHYRDSDDIAKARHYLPLAGERAQALNANREAYGWFTDAAEAFADDPERRAEMIEAAAQQPYLLGEIDTAKKQQEEAIRLYESVGADRAALNARRWLGRFSWLLGDPREAQRQIGLAIDGLERMGPSPELAMAYSFRSQSVMLEPDFEAAAEWARKAIAVAESTDATAALVHAYNNLGYCLLSQGDATGADYLRRSRDLGLQHHLPDDVGRAYANLSGQGTRIFPFSYAETEALMTEAIEYAARTIPDGIFDRWIRSGWGEFLLISGRWAEAERVLWDIDPSAAEAYLRSEVLSLRAHLLAYRGQTEEGSSIASGAAETAVRIGDIQAVLPALAPLAASQAGLGEDASAGATIRRAIEHRGTNRESIISSWFLFEAVDTLTAIHARNPDSEALRAGIEALTAFATALAPDAARTGDLVQAEVRQALFGAATDQLARIARSAGVPFTPPTESLPDTASALAILDRERRPFDAARIRLWLAEAGDAEAATRGSVSATFEEVGAHPYLARANRLGD
jgi:tetratricopeptide (TPR) repeat protein